ncbi:hypothetical protein LTS08_005839 [Lithohypha guttulata]|uniref:uncharacterized protein n=1 Tax=Lithohypha guttulata TaxID=1690604 RepID=UPI002DDDD8CC|nr:hypothetical protein LTR51_002352 [Lithohypha guttulata]KAK5099258.1 hypothetical protein LTS08_005839 [Lithohypha guttulata]
MTRWFPWGNTSNDEKPSQQDNEVAPKDTPGIQSDPLTGQHDDAMLVDARVESIANSTQEQKHDDNLGDNTESSLHNHAEETVRVVKRPKAESDMDEDNIEYVSPSKKPRSPAPQSDAESLPPQAHETERVDSPNNSDHSTALNDTGFEDHPEPNTNLLRNLETRPITVPQLIQEVKGIYAGLVMVEKKCTEIVTQQTTNPTKLSKEQWQALIALHRTLLNEHHDFFSASHHPITKGHELRELAARYAMPARMWRHGIHAFLELLRHRLPDSLEHMLSFVYLAYSMMALLKETVPDFEETWIECLGDLARYRMAIEEVDLRDREVWSNTARTWYNEAADLSPNTGRIQHHLAVLARPNIVQQLFLYSKALVAAIPFKNAGESILLLFNPLLDQPSASTSRYQPAELSFVCAAAVLFKRRSATEFEKHRAQFASHLEGHMTRSGSRFKVQGPEFAGALFAMLMDFGNAENHLWSLLFKHQQDMKQQYCDKHAKEVDKLPKDFVVQEPELINPKRAEYWARPDIHHVQVEVPDSRLEKEVMLSDDVTSYVGPMLYKTIADVAGQIGNKNVVPFMHQILAHLHALTWIPGASIYVERYIPWDSLVQFLNTVGRSGVSYENVEHDEFPRSFGGNKRQLPEDFVMRGLMSMTTYYGANFFKPEDLVDEDERLLEQPSHQAPRVERCLYCAIQLTKLTNRWMSYDYKDKKFSTTEFIREIRQP